MIFSLVITVVVLIALRETAEPSVLKGLGAVLPPFIVFLFALLSASSSAIAGSDNIPAYIALPVLAMIGFAVGAVIAKRQSADQETADE
jgi:hypothetical protein